MTLGQNIQTARKAKGMSQETLAEKIGVSRQALGKWEKDTALPGLDNLQALAAELGTGVDALLGAQAESPAAPAVTPCGTCWPPAMPRKSAAAGCGAVPRARPSLCWRGCWPERRCSMSGRSTR